MSDQRTQPKPRRSTPSCGDPMFPRNRIAPYLLLFLLASRPSSAVTHNGRPLVLRHRLDPSNLDVSLVSNQSPKPPSSSSPSPPPPPAPPTTFFEVTRPIPLPRNPTRCSTLVLQHDFAATYGQPPVTAPYTPPSGCDDNRSKHYHKSGKKAAPRRPSKILLEWRAFCRGRQFDRIFGVWAGGVELLRSCTAEPRPNGIVWTVEKDVTRYASLLGTNQTFAVYLGNVVDSTYTGIYHVNLTVHFYYDSSRSSATTTRDFSSPRRLMSRTHHQTIPGFTKPADLILPISRDPPLNDALWFQVEDSASPQSKQVSIPTNTYRAVLEIYVSFHSSDEFWYTNPPDDYLIANNLSSSSTPAHGSFREVTVTVDGTAVGAVWPFTVIYTGGINPLLWRPITGIGSYDLPTYDIELTPFLGKLLDGKPHAFGFGVTNALSVWFVDANLHLWLDPEVGSTTSGSLVKYEAPEYAPSLVSKFKGLDGDFTTTASRRISATGWVKSASYGKITTNFYQEFGFSNLMQFQANGTVQVVNQTIDCNYGIYAKNPGSVLYSEQIWHSFPLFIYTGTVDEANGSYREVSNVSFAFDEKRFSGEKFGFSFSSLKNRQDAQGSMLVKGNLVQSGLGQTLQVYRFESTEGCYFRNVSSFNYMILNDDSGEACTNHLHLGSWSLLKNKWMPPL